MAATVSPASMNGLSTFTSLVNSAICLKLAQAQEITQDNAADDDLKGNVTIANQLQGPPTFKDKNAALFKPDQVLVPDGKGGVWSFGSMCGYYEFTASSADNVTQDGTQLGDSGDENKPSNTGNTAATDGTNSRFRIYPNGLDPAAGQLSSAETAFETARNQAFNKLIQQIISSDYVVDLVGGTYYGGDATKYADRAQSLATLHQDFNAYEQTVLQTAGTEISTSNKGGLSVIKAQALQMGWAGAGVMSPELVTAGLAMDSLASRQPTSVAPIANQGGPTFAAQMTALTAAFSSDEVTQIYGAHTDQAATAANVATAADGQEDLISALASNPVEFQSAVGTYMSDSFARFILSHTQLSTINPIGQIADTGEWSKGVGYTLVASAFMLNLLSHSWTADVVGTVTSAVGGPEAAGAFLTTVAVSRVLKPILNWLTGIMIPLGLVLIAIGIFMSYIVPLIPYLVWVIALGGWALFVLEVVLLMPFCAFTAITPEGDTLTTQKQTYGLHMLLALLFYPTLMLLGLIASNIAVSVTVNIINQTYATGIEAVGSIDDPFGVVALLFVQCIIYFEVIKRGYRLITILPDFALSYLGVNANIGSRYGDSHNIAMAHIDRSKPAIQKGATSTVGSMTPKKPAGGGGGGGGKTPPKTGADGGETEGAINNDRKAASDKRGNIES